MRGEMNGAANTYSRQFTFNRSVNKIHLHGVHMPDCRGSFIGIAATNQTGKKAIRMRADNKTDASEQ